jgi:hypothetical protein
VSDDLILMPEVQARRALAGRPIRLHTLVPYGSWIGCGALRVLRLTLRQAQGDTGETEVELTAGYESYKKA